MGGGEVGEGMLHILCHVAVTQRHTQSSREGGRIGWDGVGEGEVGSKAGEALGGGYAMQHCSGPPFFTCCPLPPPLSQSDSATLPAA